MIRALPEIESDLLVIGTGLAGIGAALFAADRGIPTTLVGMTGELNFASGLLDLMGIHPIAQWRCWNNPWAAIDALLRDCPEHPYGLLDRSDMRTAFQRFTSFLGDHGLPYHLEPEANQRVITPVGTVKTTYAVPVSMLHGVAALAQKAPCLMVGFTELKGFSSRQIAETLKDRWPAIGSCQIPFPGMSGELYPEHLAQALAAPTVREQLAAAIRPHLGSSLYVGLPAMLGLYDHGLVFREMQRLLERKLFEIPTMPPGITGLRLKSVFENELPRLGVATHFQQKVLTFEPRGEDGFLFGVGTQRVEWRVRCRGAILAGGRFFGRGLRADRTGIRETLFDLPVAQPARRADWHRSDLFDPAGHPVNRAGLETDSRLRPLDRQGRPAYPNLYAAGSILAHQDWTRMKCGAGLAITTAYAAVKALVGRGA